MTSFTSGERRLMTAQDLGSCAPSVTPGHAYTMPALLHRERHRRVFSVALPGRPRAAGLSFANSPAFAVSATYAVARYTTPPLPAGATGISIRPCRLDGVGRADLPPIGPYDLRDAASAGGPLIRSPRATAPRPGPPPPRRGRDRRARGRRDARGAARRRRSWFVHGATTLHSAGPSVLRDPWSTGGPVAAHDRAPKAPPPWLFAISGIPYGVGGGFGALIMPYLADHAGIDLGKIGWYGALLLVPPILQFLYAPIVDIGLARRHWLILVSVLGAACFFGALQMDLTIDSERQSFLALAVAGQLISGLSGSCNGGLMAQLMPDHLRGHPGERRAQASATCQRAVRSPGSLIILMIGNGYIDTRLVGATLVVMMVTPSLAILAVVEPRAQAQALDRRAVRRDVPGRRPGPVLARQRDQHRAVPVAGRHGCADELLHRHGGRVPRDDLGDRDHRGARERAGQRGRRARRRPPVRPLESPRGLLAVRVSDRRVRPRDDVVSAHRDDVRGRRHDLRADHRPVLRGVHRDGARDDRQGRRERVDAIRAVRGRRQRGDRVRRPRRHAVLEELRRRGHARQRRGAQHRGRRRARRRVHRDGLLQVAAPHARACRRAPAP